MKLVRDGAWPSHAPAFQAIQQWIEIHSNAELPTQRQPGTVLTDKQFAPQFEPRLDDVTASRKLVVAASLYGTEAAARYAVEFACYGMVEMRSIHLLKGPSDPFPRRLDDYSSLLPCREALRRANSYFPWHALRSPPEGVGSICALDCTSFASPILGSAFGNEVLCSPLMQDGPETLALVTGLVWGTGLRVIQSWRGTPLEVESVLPFRLRSGGGGVTNPVELLPKGFWRRSRQRSLPVRELSDLMGKLPGLPSRSRRRLDIALRRLRNPARSWTRKTA